MSGNCTWREIPYIDTDPTDDVLNGVNVGSGVQVFKDKSGQNLRFRTLVGGEFVNLTESANEILIETESAPYVSISLPCGQNISALKLVYNTPTGLFYADNATAFENANIVGISLDGGLTGQNIRVLIQGVYTDPSFASFTLNQLIFVGSSGGLTNTAPVFPGQLFRTVVGKYIGSNKVLFQIEPPITLS